MGTEAGGAPARGRIRRQLPSLLELLALTGLAVTQPVLDVFGKAPDTFVARDAGTADIVAFALAVALLPALALWALELVVAAVDARAARWLHLGLVGGLAATAAVVVGEKATDLGRRALLVGAVVLGIALAVLVARVAPVRSWLRILGVAPVVFTGLFLFASPVSDVAFPSLFSSSSDATEGVRVGRPAPVVMIVLDELPLASLLDGEGRIDRELYPGFARLAENSTWYRNHTTVSPNTVNAVPAILSGRYPEAPETAPVLTNYPDNLFTLLEDDYEVRANETMTRLCTAPCVSTGGDVADGGVGGLLGEAVDVWGDIVRPSEESTGVAVAAHSPIDLEAGARFEDFTASLGRSDRPRLDFLHVLLPHGPFHHLPSGLEYDGPNPPDGFYACCWIDQDRADLAHQRHLLQMRYTDELLGRLIDRMEELGTWDDSLVVVTADHGTSFREGEPARGVSTGNYPDILWTPLFVKAPRQPEGSVSDVPARSVDVAPTMADILGVEPPWSGDGRSLVGADGGGDESRRVLRWSANRLEPSDGNYLVLDGRAGFETVLRSGGDVSDGADGLWRLGRYGHLVGTRLDDLTVTDPAPASGRLDDPAALDDVRTGGGETVPVYISGEIDADDAPPVVVSVNGVVGGWSGTDVRKYPNADTAARFGATVPEGAERIGTFAMVVPPSLLRDGDNDVRLFVVRGAEGDETLAPVALR